VKLPRRYVGGAVALRRAFHCGRILEHIGVFWHVLRLGCRGEGRQIARHICGPAACSRRWEPHTHVSHKTRPQWQCTVRTDWAHETGMERLRSAPCSRWQSGGAPSPSPRLRSSSTATKVAKSLKETVASLFALLPAGLLFVTRLPSSCVLSTCSFGWRRRLRMPGRPAIGPARAGVGWRRQRTPPAQRRRRLPHSAAPYPAGSVASANLLLSSAVDARRGANIE
jgi:hypothetical protein